MKLIFLAINKVNYKIKFLIMKKVLTIITSFLISISAFAAVDYSFGTEIIPIPESIVKPIAKVIPDSLSSNFNLNNTVICVEADTQDFCKSRFDFSKIEGLDRKELQNFLVECSKKKDIDLVGSSVKAGLYGWLLIQYVEKDPEGQAFFQTLPLSDRIQLAINARASYLFIQSGAITGTEFWTAKSADKFAFWTSSWKPDPWECNAFAEKFGKDKETVTNEIYSTFLAKGNFDVVYQTFFKNYIKTVPVEKAKTIIKNELLAFTSIMNPDDEVQAKWLTTLRLLNTTYSEL